MEDCNLSGVWLFSLKESLNFYINLTFWVCHEAILYTRQGQMRAQLLCVRVNRCVYWETPPSAIWPCFPFILENLGSQGTAASATTSQPFLSTASTRRRLLNQNCAAGLTGGFPGWEDWGSMCPVWNSCFLWPPLPDCRLPPGRFVCVHSSALSVGSVNTVLVFSLSGKITP